jgi:hypothetical protein
MRHSKPQRLVSDRVAGIERRTTTIFASHDYFVLSELYEQFERLSTIFGALRDTTRRTLRQSRSPVLGWAMLWMRRFALVALATAPTALIIATLGWVIGSPRASEDIVASFTRRAPRGTSSFSECYVFS